jgi:hypothetical protein
MYTSLFVTGEAAGGPHYALDLRAFPAHLSHIKVVAVNDFEAQPEPKPTKRYLSFKSGERLTITHYEAGNPWLTGYVDADPTRQGMFSDSHIQILDPAHSNLIALLRSQQR